MKNYRYKSHIGFEPKVQMMQYGALLTYVPMWFIIRKTK